MSSPDIAAVILAAGRSSRMGEPKEALRLPGGDTFLRRIAAELLAGGAATVIVVVSADDPAVREPAASVLPASVRYIVNPDAGRGQLSSLQCGLAAARDAPAVLVTLVDVPLVTRTLVGALIDAWQSSAAPLVRPTRAGRHGHPILVAQPLIGELLTADPASTARAVVRHYATAGVELEIDDEGPFVDVDTPEEYARLIASLNVDR